MTPADIYAQWPILALVAFVAIGVFVAGWRVWNELKSFQIQEAEEWREFIRSESAASRQWYEAQAQQMRAYQIEMANTIDKLAARIQNLESVTLQFSSGFTTALDIMLKRESGTGPLPKIDGK